MTSGGTRRGGPPSRIGTAERNAAMNALNAHLEAGRLQVEEYADRSAVAANATTAADLAALFTDLPAPHPDLPGFPAAAAPAVPPDWAPAATGSSAAPAVPGSWLQTYAPRLRAVVPIVAVALFLLTRNWVFFLLIPIAFVLLGQAGRQR